MAIEAAPALGRRAAALAAHTAPRQRSGRPPAQWQRRRGRSSRRPPQAGGCARPPKGLIFAFILVLAALVGVVGYCGYRYSEFKPKGQSAGQEADLTLRETELGLLKKELKDKRIERRRQRMRFRRSRMRLPSSPALGW